MRTPLVLTLTAFALAPAGHGADAAREAGRSFIYVCEDAGAGAYEAFPDVCRLRDGRLLCVFYAGWEHVSLPDEARPNGGRVSGCYSSDEGRTWTSAETIYDGPDDDRDPSVVQLPDGTILCNFFSLRKTGDRKWEGLGSWLVASTDNGKTWSEPRRIAEDYYCSAPIRILSDGTLILGLYRETGDDANGAVTLSKDMGATWSAPIDIDNGGLRLDAETDIIELADGRLYAAQRTRSESMRYAISEDRGKTWSVSKPMGFPGHCPHLHRSPEGVIVCAHRVPNTSLHYSTDECVTWSENVIIDEVGGAYPSMATLKDGSILIVYYEEGAGSSIRARKFRATKEGIQWLEW
ncbi:MAG TPA: sialidase family protein [Candidatus Hydrogenedentes bacterium]|nr:sialidase family protein [Candidatus Hydrogenedentota bacterium]